MRRNLFLLYLMHEAVLSIFDIFPILFYSMSLKKIASHKPIKYPNQIVDNDFSD